MSTRRPAKPAELTTRSDDQFVTIKRTFQVVTPVFGGGVRINKYATHQKEIDTVTPVRGASVRGQLRFWWRATHGCTCASVKEMREREGALWGAASVAGRVSLTIKAGVGATAPEVVEVYELSDRGRLVSKRDNKEIAYGAFPLQPAQAASERSPGVLSRLGGTYELSLRVPKGHEREVADAVQAWLFFGNVGGRGRRGFGAVHSPDVGQPSAPTFLDEFKVKKTLIGVPSLHGAVLASKGEYRNGNDAWSFALGRLQAFRQGPGIGRNPGDEKRSRWPEPELVREKTGRRLPKHQPLGHPKKAPRAMFGLPIITHFKDTEDPRDTKFVPVPAGGLESSQQDRLASPLILKPLWSGQAWTASCLLLADPGRADLKVELKENDAQRTHSVEWKLTSAEAEAIAPLKGLGPDVLLAFLKFFEK
jgi:CRISPR-associated protein Cmr1